jgi:formate-dependent nitrite reductase membrane component NrfD
VTEPRDRQPEQSGRFIDSSIGLLEGEAAQQQIQGLDSRQLVRTRQPWSGAPSSLSRLPDEPTYYDRPVLKEPVWIWAVPLYLFVGGAAGSAMVLGAAAQPFDHLLAHRCHWIGALGGGLGTALLIADLGRPERFLFMLRVFRPTSPMSIGSWLLATAAPFSMGAAILFDAPVGFRRLKEFLGYSAGVLGIPLTGYTAVLLANTAVPLWQQTRRSLPWLFIGSGMFSMAAFFQFFNLARPQQDAIVRFGLAGGLMELAAARRFNSELARVPHLRKPLEDSIAGALWKASRVLTAAGLALSFLPGRPRGWRITAGALGTLGGLALRFAIFHAGRCSTSDPRATFRQQRLGHGGREVTNMAAVAGPAS